MVNVLMGNKNTNEIDILCHELANDKKFKVNSVVTGTDTITAYWKLNPDILVLDSELPDMSIQNVIDRLSCTPVERKKCNTVLTVSSNYEIKLSNIQKINKIIYKPILHNELYSAIQEISIDYNTPDLKDGEVDLILISLNLNYMSVGYMYMKDAITYCYYRPYELEYLKNVIAYISYKYNIPFSRARDSLTSCIRPFNNTSLSKSNELYYNLYNNGVENISLKNFLDKIVSYLITIKKEGRLF